MESPIECDRAEMGVFQVQYSVRAPAATIAPLAFEKCPTAVPNTECDLGPWTQRVALQRFVERNVEDAASVAIVNKTGHEIDS
jgi:hypothetical protein